MNAPVLAEDTLPTLLPDQTVSVREVFGAGAGHEGPGVLPRRQDPIVPDPRHRLLLRSAYPPWRSAPAGVRPPGDDPGLSRDRQVDPHRAGRRPAQLADDPGQPGQPRQPHRPRRARTPSSSETGARSPSFARACCRGASQRPMALVFDEYDAGRPDVMFVIQRILEAQGKLTLLDQNRVIRPNKYFRLFSTTNTIGLGRHHRLLSRHPADQSGPDGPLVDRHHAQLPEP